MLTIGRFAFTISAVRLCGCLPYECGYGCWIITAGDLRVTVYRGVVGDQPPDEDASFHGLSNVPLFRRVVVERLAHLADDRLGHFFFSWVVATVRRADE